MPINAIQRKKVSDQVFDQMKEMIISGTWKPGDKIPSENELQRIFDVSRVAVREAIKQLKSYNIIETRHGVGSFIVEADEQFLIDHIMMPVSINKANSNIIRDMMEFRIMIEVESVYLATKRADANDIIKLEQIYQQMIDNRHDIQKFAVYDLDYHKQITNMTRNVVLIRCYTYVWEYFEKMFDQVVEIIGVDKGTYYHGKILDEIKQGDARNARRTMREHLNITSEYFFEHYQS